MLNQSMPVASRTRSKRGAQPMKQCNENRKRNKLQMEYDDDESNLSIPESSYRCISSDDDDDSMEASDDPLTSTSGEDNDESEDLDYYDDDDDDDDDNDDDDDDDDDEEEDQCSSSSDGEMEIVSEHPGDGKGPNGMDICVDEDVTELSSSITKPRKQGRPAGSSKQPNLLAALSDSILEKEDIDSSTPGQAPEEVTHNSSLPLKFTFRDEQTIIPEEKTKADQEMESQWDEMQFCLASSENGSMEPSLEEVEEDPQCSSSSDGEIEFVCEYPGDGRKQEEVKEDPQCSSSSDGEIEFVCEYPGDGRKGSNGFDICIDEDVELSSSKTKPRKKGRPPGSSKRLNLLKVLSDSILHNEDIDSSTHGPAVEEVMDNNNSLPLKFTFRDEGKIIPEEKAEFDQETESLWAEMQFCLASSEIGSEETSPVESKDTDILGVEQDRATLCRQGNHHIILDEEIGMKCKFCSFVQLEIKYVTPPFMTQPYGKSERQYYGIWDCSTFDDLQFPDLYDDMPGCSDPSANIKGTVWENVPNIRSKLYPHQREGFEFIWNNIAGGIYRDKSRNSSNGGGGCIISHAPGTGKTLLTIVFLQTYFKEYPSCRPVIVAPSSMLLTWEAEFRKWHVDIPFHNLNSLDFSGKEKRTEVDLYRKFKHGVPFPDRPLAQRLVKLLSWKSDGGVLGISYRLFEQLAGRENKRKQEWSTVDKQVSKILLELPGLFVLDEGHTARNDGTLMWKALSGIKTDRRIILSGTPFQNNFDELFNTLCLVRPKFAEGIKSRHPKKVDKKHGCKTDDGKLKWAFLTGSFGKDVDMHEVEKLREIRALIKPFVHVHKGTILQRTLPGLRHSVVVLRPSDLQKKILEHVKETRNAFFLDYYVSLISIHPSLLQQLSDHKDIKESVSSIVTMDELERMRLKPRKGVKTKFLIELLKLSGALNEKVIVFSQYLEPLSLIIEQLKVFFKWNEGVEIFYMDGKCNVKQRQSLIDAFNDPRSKARVLLASTKACSEGINLVGGSRVVLLDVTWNPSVERQAISRAYRLGQKKVVYTYNLISSGTMEGLKCYRQAGKDRLSELLFSADKGENHDQKRIFNVVEDKILEEMFQHEKLKSMFEKIINHTKDSDLIRTFEGL